MARRNQVITLPIRIILLVILSICVGALFANGMCGGGHGLVSNTYTQLPTVIVNCSGYVLNITVDNITIDCNGSEFIYNGTSTDPAIIIQGNNVTVENCIFSNYTTSIYVYSGFNYTTIFNNTIINITAGGNGTYFDERNFYDQIINNTIANSTGVNHAIIVNSNSSSVNISNNFINNIGLQPFNGKFSSGIQVDDGGGGPTVNQINVSDNNLNNVSGGDSSYGIVFLGDIENSFITGNTILFNSTISSSPTISAPGGILNVFSTFDNITNNNITVVGSTGVGLALSSANNNYYVSNDITLKNATSTSYGPYGIYFSNAAGTQPSNNSIYNNLINATTSAYFNSAPQTNFWNTTLTRGTNIIGGPYIGGNFYANKSGNSFSQDFSQCIPAAPGTQPGICSNTKTLGSSNIDQLPLAIPYIEPGPNCNSGPPISSNNAWYVLTGNVSSTGSDCFDISSASNIVLDCMGHSINGLGNAGNGLNLGGNSNITIEDCVVSNYSTGIEDGNNGNNQEYLYIMNNTIINVTGYPAGSGGIGIDLIGSSFSIVNNNTIVNSNGDLQDGIWIGSNSNLTNNIITNVSLQPYTFIQFSPILVGGGAVHIDGSSNYVSGNLINVSGNATTYGIEFLNRNATGNVITNNTILFNSTAPPNTNFNYGAGISGSDPNEFIGLGQNLPTFPPGGIMIGLAERNIFANNTIVVNGSIGLGLTLIGVNNCTFTNNTIVVTNDTGAGVFFSVAGGTPNLNVTNNTIYDNIINATITGNSSNGGSVYQSDSPNNWDNTTTVSGTTIIGTSVFGGNFYANPHGNGYSENRTICNPGVDNLCHNFTAYAVLGPGNNLDPSPLTLLPSGASCLATPSCNGGTCGLTGYSNNGGSSCYSNSGCTATCSPTCSATPSCNGGTCGLTGYSNNGGTSCYSDSICTSSCTTISPPTPATDASCGMSIPSNTVLVLNGFLNCTGTALTISGSPGNIELDCNGSTIYYSNNTIGYGIDVETQNVTIANCIIMENNHSQSSYGIYLNDSPAFIINDTIITEGLWSHGIVLNGLRVSPTIANDTIITNADRSSDVVILDTSLGYGGSPPASNNILDATGDSINVLTADSNPLVGSLAYFTNTTINGTSSSGEYVSTDALSAVYLTNTTFISPSGTNSYSQTLTVESGTSIGKSAPSLGTLACSDSGSGSLSGPSQQSNPSTALSIQQPNGFLSTLPVVLFLTTVIVIVVVIFFVMGSNDKKKPWRGHR